MENRIPKCRYNGATAPDPGKTAEKPDVLKLIEEAMDKHAGGIAQTVTDMFRFMSMASAMLPNMELDVGVFRLKTSDEGVSFDIRYPADFKRTISNDSSIAKKTLAGDDEEEGLLYDGD